MKKFISQSGAEISIAPASWAQAKELKKAVERELINCDIADFLKSAIRVDSSDAVEAALWPCLIRCTRNNQKITETTFDDLESRKDYHEIAVECLWLNIGPLVESLSFLLEKHGLIKGKKIPGIPPKSE